MVTFELSGKTVGIGIIVVLLVLSGFLAYKLYLPKTGNVVSSGNPTETDPLNVFEGKITNAKVSPGRIEGSTTYDANCVGSQITECDAGIRTKEYGVVNFHYSHEMAVQPCLHMFGSEKVIVDILDSDGNAKITRTIDTSSMGGHHG